MKTFLFFITLSILTIDFGWTQNDGQAFLFTRHFTDLIESHNLVIHTDSLDHYILTNKTNPYLKSTDLYLVNPQKDQEYLVLIDENSMFPQLKFSSHVTNLMNNENEHTIAFYSLDKYFILTELRADWAMDAQFLVKDHQNVKGYARSFYRSDSDVQVTVILLAKEFPLLTTPPEMTAIRFEE